MKGGSEQACQSQLKSEGQGGQSVPWVSQLGGTGNPADNCFWVAVGLEEGEAGSDKGGNGESECG